MAERMKLRKLCLCHSNLWLVIKKKGTERRLHGARSLNKLVTGIGRASDDYLLRELFQPELGGSESKELLSISTGQLSCQPQPFQGTRTAVILNHELD